MAFVNTSTYIFDATNQDNTANNDITMFDNVEKRTNYLFSKGTVTTTTTIIATSISTATATAATLASSTLFSSSSSATAAAAAATISPFESMQNRLILLFFSLIVIVSFCGNLLVCHKLLTQRPLCSNSTKVLIGVLAISDLMMTIFNIPFTIADIILKDWIFGEFFCTLVSFVQANSVYVSSFTMAVIAINRWSVIYKFRPTKTKNALSNHSSNPSTWQPSTTTLLKRQTIISREKILSSNNAQCLCCQCITCHSLVTLCQRNQHRHEAQVSIELETVEPTAELSSYSGEHSAACIDRQEATIDVTPNRSINKIKLKPRTRLLLTVLAIWFLAALHSLPHTIFNQVKTIRVMNRFEGMNGLETIYLPKRRCTPVFPKEFGDNFSLFLTLFTAVTQYFIPLSCAGAIYTRIGFTIMAQGKVGEMTKTRVKRLTQKKRRRLLMLVLIVAIFALCWLPFNVYYLLRDFGIMKTTNYAAFLACLWLAMSSVCYNPFVYCWLNEDFQREVKLVFNRLRKCCTFNSS